MLDPKLVADHAVRRLAGSEEAARRLLDNSMYRNVTAMIAGMQEYTAAEAVHQFVKEGEYELVVLDTPPSRNALDFLDSSVRLGRLFDGKIFDLFLPGEKSPIRKAARKLVVKIMDIAFEPGTRSELESFLTLFSSIFTRLNSNASEIHAFFTTPQVAFLIVTSPAQEALQEAFYFESKTNKSMGLELEGYVLNRSLAYRDDRSLPSLEAVGPDIDPQIARTALDKLMTLALREREQAEHDRSLHRTLAEKGGPDMLSVALPYLDNGMEDIHALVHLADAFVDSRGEV
jgi:anion-transporting  ArsA/GET3 family ATPase